MRITRHTKIETPKRKMKQNFVIQYILYACTNVTKRVNREINARGDERRKMIRIGENTAHTTLDVKSTTTTGPTSLFFFIETTIKAKPSHRRSNEYSLWSSFTGCTGHIIYHGITFHSCISNFVLFSCSNTSKNLCA